MSHGDDSDISKSIVEDTGKISEKAKGAVLADNGTGVALFETKAIADKLKVVEKGSIAV